MFVEHVYIGNKDSLLLLSKRLKTFFYISKFLVT